jgi:microcystin-dependent protein
LAVVLTAASMARAIQTQVMIQGFLTNPSGTPYTTAQATEFRVYQGGNATTAGSGTLYYDETATVTPSASGVFNYPLGSGAPTVPFLVVSGATIPNILSTTTFDTSSAVYLEISVGGTVVLPRLQMLGTPYAALAGTSESLKPTTQPLITTSNLQASSGTFTASGSNQASLATSSSIIVNAGGVTAPYFNGTLNGNVNGTVTGGAGSVAAGSVTPGTFGPGVLVLPANVVGGIASTNTINTFPLPQSFPGGVIGSSANFTNGVTAASGTFTASGPTQYSLTTASGIIVAAGGVTAPYFNGMLIGSVSGGAGSVAAGSVTPGTFVPGVLVPPQNVIGGLASTNTVNTFPLIQSFPGGVTASSANFTNGITAASGTFTANGPNQASLATSSSIIVNAGGVTAPYFNGTLNGNVNGTVTGGAGSVAAGSVTPGTFGPGVLVPPANVVGGLASTNTVNTFPLVQSFPGGVVGSSASFANGVTAASATLTASGSTQYSLSAASGIVVAAGGVTAPYFNGMVIGNIPGNAANVTGTVAVANGGTGAATAAGAQTNLGVPSTTGSGASGTWGISITGSAGSTAGAPPIGSIVLYAGETEPPGWIETDGRSLSQSGTYSASWGNFNTAAIFAALGTAWGSSGAGVFNIPDFRGTFPRGWNHGKTGSYSDPDASARTNQYTSGTTGDNVGSYQVDAFRSHTHTTTAFNGYTSGGSAFTGYLSVSSLGNTSGASGGNETRPTNASVMYIIRVQ